MPSEDPPSRPNRWNGRVSITVTPTTSIFLLVLVSVGSVLWIGLWLAQKNTFSLLSENVHLSITGAVSSVQTHLLPAQHQAAFVARRIESGEVDPNDRRAMEALLTGALAATPQVDAVIRINSEFKALLATRTEVENEVQIVDEDYSRDAVVRRQFLQVDRTPLWTPPIWRKDVAQTFISIAHPLQIDDRFAGAPYP